MCFWMWSFPGFIWRSRSLSLVLGLSARWVSARGWVMFSLRKHDHRDAALQIPPRQTGGYPKKKKPCHALLAPPGLGGLLKLMVRVTWGSQWELPRRVRLRRPLTPPAHCTIWCFWTSLRCPRIGRGQASCPEHQRMTGCRSLHRRAS